MSFALLEAGVLRLATRRLLSRSVIALALAAGLAFALLPGSPGLGDASLVRGVRREAAWAGLGLFAFPLVVHAAASLGRRWRGGDRAWLRSTPRVAVALSTWLGTWVGGLVLLAGIALVAEVRAGGAGNGEHARRVVRALEAPRAALVVPGETVTWTAPDPERPGSANALSPARLRLALGTAPGSGPTARVRFVCRRGDEVQTAEALVFGRTSVELPLPRTAGDLVLEVTRVGEGCAVLVGSSSLSLLREEARERMASLELFRRAALFLGAASALALGLGAWMRASAATGLVLALSLPVLGAGRSVAFLPGADLLLALGEVGDGLVPPAPDAFSLPELAGLALALALGVALAARGLDANDEREGGAS